MRLMHFERGCKRRVRVLVDFNSGIDCKEIATSFPPSYPNTIVHKSRFVSQYPVNGTLPAYQVDLSRCTSNYATDDSIRDRIIDTQDRSLFTRRV